MYGEIWDLEIVLWLDFIFPGYVIKQHCPLLI